MGNVPMLLGATMSRLDRSFLIRGLTTENGLVSGLMGFSERGRDGGHRNPSPSHQ